MIILIGGEKGGTGKTTLATNLAAMRVNLTGDLLIIDTDKQGSASAWAAIRETNLGTRRVSSVQKFGKTITSEIRDLEKRYQDIIVDAGGRDSIELRAAMTVAHQLIVPIQASQFDVWTLGAMNDLITQAKVFNSDLKAFVVLNRASPNPSVKETQEVKELLQDFEHLTLCQTIIYDRIAYRKAAKNGLAVVELQPKEVKGSEEMESVYAFVFNGT